MAAGRSRPTHYAIFGKEWKAMLEIIRLADGSPCPAFHASAMMHQSPPFNGWTVNAVNAAFEKATAVIENHRHWAMKPVGVAAEIPATFKDVPRDAIWLMLFVNLFRVVFVVSGLEAHAPPDGQRTAAGVPHSMRAEISSMS